MESSTGALWASFTPQELERLVRVQSAFAQGRPLDTTQECNRLLFARRLVTHQRLDG